MTREIASADANQPAIVRALRQCGCLVQSLHTVGRGVPDLLICYRGILALVEVKTSNGRYTKKQVQWHTEWQEAPIFTIKDADQIEDLLNTLEQRYARKP